MMSAGYNPALYDAATGMQYYPAAAFVQPPPAYELIPYRVFVGGFPVATTETELRTHFEQYFRIREAKVIRTTDGISKGYGFITFDTEQEAEAVRSMTPEKLEFKGRKLNLGPALRRLSVNRYHHPGDYAIATPTGIVPSAPFGFAYPMPHPSPYVMMHPQVPPQFVYNSPPNGLSPSQHNVNYGQPPHISPTPPTDIASMNSMIAQVQQHQIQQQALQQNHQQSAQQESNDSAGACSSVSNGDMYSSTPQKALSHSPPVSMSGYNYGYYMQPATPVTPAHVGMPVARGNTQSTSGTSYMSATQQHASYYHVPDGILTPMSASYTGFPLHQLPQNGSQAGSGYCNQPMIGAGDSAAVSIPQQQTFEDSIMSAPQKSVYFTPPSHGRGYSMITPPTDVDAGSETPRQHSTAVRRINLFADTSKSKETQPSQIASVLGSFTTPVRLEARPRGPDGQYKQVSKAKVAANHVRFIRSPPSDTKSLPPGRPKMARNGKSGSPNRAAASLSGQFQSMHVTSGYAHEDRSPDGSVLKLRSASSSPLF